MKRRVVITGLGVVSPIGNNINEMWDSVTVGRNGIGLITNFDISNYNVKLGAEVKKLDLNQYITPKEARKLDKFSQFAIVAAKQAYDDAQFNKIEDTVDKTRMGVIIGAGIGGLQTIEDNAIKLEAKGPDRVSPQFIPMSIVNLAAGNVAISLGAKGMCSSAVTACSAGADSIGLAYKEVAYGYHDVIFAGGSEASITPLGIAGFSVMKATTTCTDPSRASIPFDKDRSGFVMGEGAGVLVVEALDNAIKRGAKIYAEIIGYGATCDAHHITAPSPGGEGASRAMQIAIQSANIDISNIEYINAHGTSTPLNDSTETTAVKNTFGDHAYKLSISSTKSMTGHLLGASGALESIITIKALQQDFLPPTINYKERDENCDLDIVANIGRKRVLNYAMSNSFGFGGHNACLVFKKWAS